MSNAYERLHISKLDAARRQLKASIRLFFFDEDELAIHTVASAAYQLITDLKNKPGESLFLLKDFFGHPARKNRQKLRDRQCLRRPDSSASPRFDPTRGSILRLSHDLTPFRDALQVFSASLRKPARRYGYRGLKKSSLRWRSVSKIFSEGMKEPEDQFSATFLYLIQDFQNGTLPKCISANTEVMAKIAKFASQFPIGADLNIEDFVVTLDAEARKAFWKKRNKISNFLKHADKDAEKHMGIYEIDNLFLLMQALAAYTDLVKNDFSAESYVLCLYGSLAIGDADILPGPFQSIGRDLLELQEDERRSICATLIHELQGLGGLK